eukprot:14400366-Alexandrium_andersonii.AAC.1
MTIRTKGFDLIIVFAYFQDGAGREGNAELMNELGTFLREMRSPYMLVADVNMEPDELDQDGWVG